MRLDALPIGLTPPDDVNVVITAPAGSEPIIYALDDGVGALRVERFLETPLRYPGNAGLIPHTRSAKGQPLAVLIPDPRPLLPGAVVNTRPIGLLRFEDAQGIEERIIAIPCGRLAPPYARVMDYVDLPQAVLERVQHFFEHWQDLERGVWVRFLGWGGAEEARQVLTEAIARASRGGTSERPLRICP